MQEANVSNKPIMYDDHGDIPLSTPFAELRPSEITFYLEMDTRVGRQTCRQTCEHCFFIREEEAQNRVIELAEGYNLMNALRRQGYKVFPMVSDNFAYGGHFLRVFGDPKAASPVHDFHQGLDRALAKTMERGEIWTSGAHLLDDNWQELLILALENGFGTITFTLHGVPDDQLTLPPREQYPIGGVFYGLDAEVIIGRIHSFNRDLALGRIRHQFAAETNLEPLAINVTATVGTHNRSRQTLLNYLRYCEKMGIAVLRFNRYKTHGERLPQLALSADDVGQFFIDLKWIHANVTSKVQLAVSEDFGTSGIEIMEFPEHTGWCRAGHQFFTVVGDRNAVLYEDNRQLRERMGAIACCVEIYKPSAGQIVRVTDKATGSVTYDVEFFPQVIAELQRMRQDGTLRDGCWAPEYSALHRTGAVRQNSLSTLSVAEPVSALLAVEKVR